MYASRIAKKTSVRGILRAGLVSIALAFLAACPAAAQSYYGPTVELTAFNGWLVMSNLYQSGGAEIGVDDAYQFGARLGYFPNRQFGIEGSWSHASSDLTLEDFSFTPDDTPLGSVSMDQWDLNFVTQQTAMGSPNLTGFFTMGIGATHFGLDSARSGADESNTHFAFNFGLGAKVDMNPKLALRFDARYRATETDITTDSDVYCDIYGYCYSYSTDWYDTGEFSAGLTYRFGR